MKKIFTLTVALSIVTFICAQTINKIGMTGPEFVKEFNTGDVTALGISSDGNIVYGQNPGTSAVFYNFNNPSNPYSMIEAGEADFYGITVGGVTNDNTALVSHYMYSYLYDVNNKTKIELVSPNEDKGVDGWAISADGKYIGCNLTSDDFTVEPMVAIRQADGTYKMQLLEYDKMDAMGCVAQYTQVRFISEDGSYIMGIQPDNRGMGGRLVVWVRQEDGSYKFTTPMDEFLYDLSCEKPGMAPEWDDIVTADPEKENDLFNQQMAEFDKAFNEYEAKYKKFTNNDSSLEIYLMHKSVRGNVICMGFYDKRNSTEDDPDVMVPVFYDCDNNKISEYPEMKNSFGFENLPGGGYIVATENAGLYSITAIQSDGQTKPMHEWINEVTGTDLTDTYTFSFFDMMTEQTVEGVFLGLPYFSYDGKTLMLSGYDPDNGTMTSIFKFDSDIFEETTTGIKANVVDQITFGNGTMNIGDKHGIADVYALNGSKCGSYEINGSLNLNGILAHGTYVVKMNVEGEQPVSMKIMIK